MLECFLCARVRCRSLIITHLSWLSLFSSLISRPSSLARSRRLRRHPRSACATMGGAEWTAVNALALTTAAATESVTQESAAATSHGPVRTAPHLAATQTATATGRARRVCASALQIGRSIRIALTHRAREGVTVQPPHARSTGLAVTTRL